MSSYYRRVGDRPDSTCRALMVTNKGGKTRDARLRSDLKDTIGDTSASAPKALLSGLPGVLRPLVQAVHYGLAASSSSGRVAQVIIDKIIHRMPPHQLFVDSFSAYPDVRAGALKRFATHGRLRNLLDVLQEMAHEDYNNPVVRLAGRKLFEGVLGPHATAEDAGRMLRARILRMHPNKLTNDMLQDGVAEQGRDAMLTVLLGLKKLLHERHLREAIYSERVLTYGRDLTFPIKKAAWCLSATAAILLSAGMFCGNKLALEAVKYVLLTCMLSVFSRLACGWWYAV